MLPLIPLLNNLNPFDIELIALTIFENANSKGNIPATNPAITIIVFLVPSLKPLNLLIILVNIPINGVKHNKNCPKLVNKFCTDLPNVLELLAALSLVLM